MIKIFLLLTITGKGVFGYLSNLSEIKKDF